MKKTPPKAVLVAWCPHCGAVDAVVTPEQKKAERIGVGTCGQCKPAPRGRRWRLWVTYALPVHGVCRECGCTECDPCPEGCGWTDRTHTLCTACWVPPPARDARAQARSAKKLARVRKDGIL